MWKNRLAYGLVLLTAAVLLFLYSKPFLLTVLIVLLLLMVINGMLVLHMMRTAFAFLCVSAPVVSKARTLT